MTKNERSLGMQDEATTVRDPERVGQRMFQLGCSTGRGGAVVPGLGHDGSGSS